MSHTKTNVLIIVRWPVGGINTYLRYIYTDRHFSDYQLDILLPDISEINILHEEMQANNIRILPVSGGAANFYYSIWRYVLSRKYKLVHSHGFSSGLLAAIPAKLIGIKHIITPHDIFSKKHFSGIKGKIKRYFVGRILSLANVIQPVSQGAANNLLEFMPTLQNNRKQKIITIVNGIDTSRFLIQESRDLHSELSLDRNVFLVGFLGRFMSQKGFTYLVQAVKKLLLDTSINRKIKIIAIGSGGYIREEMEGIESQGMKDDVYFLPGTNEVAKTLRGLDLLAMPSLWEACSLLAMEALVAGVPVVGTKTAKSAFAVTAKNNVLVDAFSFAGFLIDENGTVLPINSCNI